MPQQELVALLKFVTEDLPGRIVIHATETLGNLASYDSVLILHEGRVCFHGPPRALTHYFSISTVDELYPRLAQRPAERWGNLGHAIASPIIRPFKSPVPRPNLAHRHTTKPPIQPGPKTSSPRQRRPSSLCQ